MLLALYGLLTLPFFCGAACIGLALACFEVPVGRIYRADLLGAGAGALGIVALLFVIMPDTALKAIGALGRSRPPRSRASPTAGGRACAPCCSRSPRWPLPALPDAWTALQLSPYKGLRQALQVPGAVVESERSSPLGLLERGAKPRDPVPPCAGPEPQQHDRAAGADRASSPTATGLSPITAFDGDLAPLAYLDLTTSALPYHLLERPEVLILGAGGGADVLSAALAWRRQDRCGRAQPAVRGAWCARPMRDFAGRLYDRPEVQLHIAEARGFVAGTDRRYDLIAAAAPGFLRRQRRLGQPACELRLHGRGDRRPISIT